MGGFHEVSVYNQDLGPPDVDRWLDPDRLSLVDQFAGAGQTCGAAGRVMQSLPTARTLPVVGDRRLQLHLTTVVGHRECAT